MRLSITFLLATICILTSNGQNPITTKFFTADPAAMVYNETVYLYTGHDEAPNPQAGYVMNDWQLFTTTDMVNWTAHGEILHVDAFRWSKGDAWAAEVEERNGKFYFYVCTEHKSIPGKAIGVAVADSPAGPFTDARGSALITNDMTTQVDITWDDIDPTVIVDDDGQAYIYWGNTGCYYARLKDNMIELDGEITFVNLPSFTEAPFIHKKDGIYYLTYAYGWEEKIAYATALAIIGPWTFRGVLNDYVNNSNTNHQSVIDFKNQWYFVYHTGDIGGSYQRSVAVDYLFYNEDGSICEIVQTREGVQSTEQTQNCLPMPVNLSFKVNTDSFTSGKSAFLKIGNDITIRSEIADTGGNWEWSGPNGFSATATELSFENIKVDLTGEYKVVYTNACGTRCIAFFEIAVNPITIGNTFMIKPYGSDLKVSLENGNENGTNVHLATDNQTGNQQFIFTNADGKYYRITPKNAPSRSIDVFDVSVEDSANLIIWDFWRGNGQLFINQPSNNASNSST